MSSYNRVELQPRPVAIVSSCDRVKLQPFRVATMSSLQPSLVETGAQLQRAFFVRRICLQLKITERKHQRICIKFCFNLGKSCTEKIEMIQKAFLDESMGITQIKEWYRSGTGGLKMAAHLLTVTLVLVDLR